VGITFTLEKANRDLTGKLDELRVKAGLVDFLDRKFLVNEGINNNLIKIIEENNIKIENRKLRGLKILNQLKTTNLPLTLEDGSQVAFSVHEINDQGIAFFIINNQDYGTMNLPDMINFLNKYDPDKKFFKKDLDNLFKKDAHVDVSHNEALLKKLGLSDKLIDSISGWGIRLDSSTMGGLQAFNDLFSGKIERVVWPGEDYKNFSLSIAGGIQENGQVSILYNGEKKEWNFREVVNLLINVKKKYGITDNPSDFPGRPVDMAEVKQMEHYANPAEGFVIDLNRKREKVKKQGQMFESANEAINFFKQSVKLDVMPTERLEFFKSFTQVKEISDNTDFVREMYFSEKNPGNRKKMRSYMKEYMGVDPEPEKAFSYKLNALKERAQNNWKQTMDNLKESIEEVKRKASEKKKNEAGNTEASAAASEAEENVATKKKQRINRGKKRKKKK